MIKQATAVLATLAVAMVWSAPAFAHPEGHEGGFVAGLLHPITGLDHLATMFAMGWLLMGTRSVTFAGCALFAACMAAGAFAGWASAAPTNVDPTIGVGLVVLGALLALVHRPSALFALPLVAVTAALHGFAHGAEFNADPHIGAYVVGFLVSTVALLAAGIAAGVWMQQSLAQHETPARLVSGVALAVGGVATLFAAA